MAACGMALLGVACASGGAWRREPVAFEIRGAVVNETGPQAAVRVLLAGTRFGAVTDAEGAFRIRGTARPGRYVLHAARLGLAPLRRRVDIHRPGVVDTGTLRMPPQIIYLDDRVVPECLRYDQPPADTVGARVRMETDSTGTFWTVCRPPRE